MISSNVLLLEILSNICPALVCLFPIPAAVARQLLTPACTYIHRYSVKGLLRVDVRVYFSETVEISKA